MKTKKPCSGQNCKLSGNCKNYSKSASKEDWSPDAKGIEETITKCEYFEPKWKFYMKK